VRSETTLGEVKLEGAYALSYVIAARAKASRCGLVRRPYP
jgi:hypothetical protein